MNTDASILVVDDEPLLRELISEWLSDEGYRVRTAENGFDALRVLEVEHIAVVVTDIRMPKMDGVALLKTLKNSASHTPAVFRNRLRRYRPERSLRPGGRIRDL